MNSIKKKFEHLQIPLEAINSATNNFADANRIGNGGFGKVYKGELVLSQGQTVVAIKRLDPAFGQGNPEFWKEIIMLSLYKHDNVVSLLGFCDDHGEKVLVYEYASKRSLDMYLNSNDLTWVLRLKICIGAARGLAFLHNPIRTTHQRVLHRDIKSSNILLDEDWNPRISDLGLSKFGPANQQYSFLVSNAVGTVGYCDPLYVETGLLTKESDVYSFGVVLFEILCGRLCMGSSSKHRPLTGLVREYYEQNKINELIFGNIKDEINPDSLEAFTTIAYQCLRRDREERPSMNEILGILEHALEYQCHSGQTLCSTCKTWVHNRCPTCRQEFGDIQDLSLEKVADSLEFACKYCSLGCPEIFPYNTKLKHELICNFRPYSCPYAGSECSAVGDIPYLVTHLRDDHKVDMHTGCTFNIRYFKSNPFEVENATWMLTVFHCFGHYFCLHFEAFQVSMAPVYMAFILFMGDEQEARNYSYSLEVGGNGRKLVWEGTPRSIRDSHRMVRDSDDGLIIKRNMGLFFSGGERNELKLRVTGRIWKDSPNPDAGPGVPILYS